jgi:hypothetical protein
VSEDDFWKPESKRPVRWHPRGSRHHHHDEDRELTRDEVYAPEIFGGFLGEWKRDQAFFQYRLIKSAGPLGVLLVVLVLVGIAFYMVVSLVALAASWF